MLSRRKFFGLSGAVAASLALPRRVRAATGSNRKLIVVFAQGGWDPTRVFADGFDISGVSMESAAARATAGGIRYVDHPDRPSVKAFFEANHRRSVVVNGVMVRSIAHEICTMIAMTGSSSGVDPDWPAIVGARAGDACVLPHLVLGGPSFPGDLGVYVARTGSNGQLEALLDGQALDMSDQVIQAIRSPSQKVVDNFLARRAAAKRDYAASALEASLYTDFATAVQHMEELKDLQYEIDFTTGGDLESSIGVAVDALSMGVSRCVTLGSGASFSWDTHAQNDDQQSPLWEQTFYGLAQLAAALDAAPGETAATLAEETTVVVLSEMGRTPALNAFNGKDHWPYTSVLMFGAGLVGDQTIGGWDDSWYGQTVDPTTGELDENGQIISAESIGATLLALADVDPADYITGVDPLMGVVS